jgi:hypothetical protein
VGVKRAAVRVRLLDACSALRERRQAGQRGTRYARWALRHPDRASVVAVAEPREVRRARFAAE